MYKLQHSDNSFYQPNYYSLSKMIEFISNHLENCEDLLELYCGCGSFTIPLATKFNRIFASDNNRDNINNLKKNLEMNKVSNVSFARISDDELSQAMGGRAFNRLRNIEINLFKFSHILVDPPRMGLHKDLIERLVQFKNIIYVSCNPNTFLRDLNYLEDYKVKSLAVFDQFSNTEHLELIGILSR
jgi:tRNA (uracil-5-)-methyltransferase